METHRKTGDRRALIGICGLCRTDAEPQRDVFQVPGDDLRGVPCYSGCTDAAGDCMIVLAKGGGGVEKIRKWRVNWVMGVGKIIGIKTGMTSVRGVL